MTIYAPDFVGGGWTWKDIGVNGATLPRVTPFRVKTYGASPIDLGLDAYWYGEFSGGPPHGATDYRIHLGCRVSAASGQRGLNIMVASNNGSYGPTSWANTLSQPSDWGEAPGWPISGGPIPSAGCSPFRYIYYAFSNSAIQYGASGLFVVIIEEAP